MYSLIAHPCWSGIFPGLFSLWRRAPVWGCRGPPAPQLWPRCLKSQTQHSNDKVDRSTDGLAAKTAGTQLLNSSVIMCWRTITYADLYTLFISMWRVVYCVHSKSGHAGAVTFTPRSGDTAYCFSTVVTDKENEHTQKIWVLTSWLWEQRGVSLTHLLADHSWGATSYQQWYDLSAHCQKYSGNFLLQ